MKKGIMTSEFWVMVIAGLWFMGMQSGYIQTTPADMAGMIQQAPPVIEGAKTTADKIIAAAEKIQQHRPTGEGARSNGWEVLALAAWWVYNRHQLKRGGNGSENQ